jgi:aminopeptidase N
MRYTLILLVLFLASQLSAQHQEMLNGIHQNEGAELCAHHKKQHIQLQKASQQKSHAGQNIDITYTRAFWEIDPSVSYIKGNVTSYFKTLSPNVKKVVFELDTSMVVDSIIYHGQSLMFADSLAYLLNVYLPNALNLGTQDSVSIYYQGSPGSSGFGSFIQSSHAGVPIIWTLSEPYGAREWWPCKNDLSDKIDSIDILVLTPAAYRAASNGLLVYEGNYGNKKLYHWKHRYPIATYLVAVAVTNYAVYSNFAQLQNSTVEVLNYVFPEDSANAAIYTPNTVDFLQNFSNLFGEYPFADEKYGHAQFGWGGGMEHQTMSFMGGFGFELVSHELAHQWFGDMVTLGSWTDIWLNEGFATYLTGLSYENLPGTPYWKNWKTSKRAHITNYNNGSVYCSDTTSVSRIFSSRLSYSKGAFTLHMLRWICGDSAFFQGVRNYLNDTNIRHGYAYTDDLKQHLESASGKNLTEFFNDWYFGEGHPNYDVLAISYPDSSMEVSIYQTPSHSSVSFFDMQVPIQFSGQGKDTIVVFDHSTSGQQFNLKLPFITDSVTFDPDIWVLGNNTVNLMVGMKQNTPQSSIKLYPNPSTEQLWITIVGQLPDFMEVVSIEGKSILQIVPTDKQLSLDVSTLSNGIYFLRIIEQGHTSVQRFIKQ